MINIKIQCEALPADTEPCHIMYKRGSYIVCIRKNNARMGFLKELIPKLVLKGRRV